MFSHSRYCSSLFSRGFYRAKQVHEATNASKFRNTISCKVTGGYAVKRSVTTNTNNFNSDQSVSLIRRRFFSSKNNSKATSEVGASNNAQKVSSTTTTATAENSTFLSRFLGPKEMPKRGTLRWYGEITLICTVFAITGTSTMVLVRPAVKKGLGLEGSLKDGPWSYRICTLVIMTPVYATLLVCVGTIFGRHFYFRHFAVKIFSRFGIPPELMDKNYHLTKKNFRKY